MTKTELLKNLKIELDYIIIRNNLTIKDSTKKYYLNCYIEDITKHFKISNIEYIRIKYIKKVIHEDIDNIIEHNIHIIINHFITIDTYFLE